VDRQADGAGGVGDAPGDGLADPPRGVGGELEALAPVELLDGVHQAEVALLDEVEEREPGGLVLLGDGHDEAQVGLHERALGVLALAQLAPQLTLLGRRELLAALLQRRPGGQAALDRLGEPDLVILGQQRVLTDVGEVQPDEVLLVALDALLPQGAPSEARSDPVHRSPYRDRQPRQPGASRPLVTHCTRAAAARHGT
jgi:hypothetical protein